MIFVDNIDIAGKLAIYLQSQLFIRLFKNRSMFLQKFLSNLTIKI